MDFEDFGVIKRVFRREISRFDKGLPSEIVQTYAFKTGMVDLRFNYATAIDLMQSIISVVLIFATNAVSKKVTDTGLF